MTPEQIWQAALGELQLQMTRATFDMWLRDTVLHEYLPRSDDDPATFVLRANTHHAQEWLRTKLNPTIQRTLTGISGAPVAIRVDVATNASSDEQPDSTETASESAELSAQPGWRALQGVLDQASHGTTQAPAPAAHRASTQPAAGTANTLYVRALARTAYESIVKPHQVVRVPRVFLTRWLRLLGPRRAWLVVSFWQFAYLAGLYPHNQGRKMTQGWLPVSGKAVARGAGLSSSTFWEYLAEPGLLKWFIHDEQRGQYKVGANARPQQDVNKYAVWLSPPLTPADQAHLRAWIASHAPTPGLPGLLVALETAMHTPPTDLLAADPAAPTPEESRPLTIAALSLQAVPNARLSVRGEEALANLCDELYAHLYNVEQDTLFIRHYFIKNWLPRIKHGAAWLVTYLRDRCSQIETNAGLDETFWVERGLETLTQLTGANDKRQVRRWLQKASRKEADEWTVADLAAVVQTRKCSDQRVDMKFRVPARREMLTSPDWAQRAESLAEYELDSALDRLTSLSESVEIDDSETKMTPDGKGGRQASDKVMAISGLIEAGGDDHFLTHRGKGRRPNPNRVETPSGHIEVGGADQFPTGWHPKNESLINLKEVVVEENKEKILDNDWDLERLLDAGRIVGDLRERALAAEVPGESYVAWYLLGVRNRRSAKGHKGIENPAAYAASQVAKGRAKCDDEQFTKLANLGSLGVAACIYWQHNANGYADDPDWEPARKWKQLLGERVTLAELALDDEYKHVTTLIQTEGG